LLSTWWRETDGTEAILNAVGGVTPTKIKLTKGGPLTVKGKLRSMISQAASSRRTKRFKRTAIIQILKGDFRPSHFKHGIDTPNDHGDAHGKHRSKKESGAWLEQENEEMETLDCHFRKKLKIEDLRKEQPDLQPISGMWVHDSHPEGVQG
jgi:hypothetical protein